ncbi:hypothetical protein ACQPYK_03540 [Streptosporangium sp. CA-135522]|uniref:hypothetical protein n=1 Tax=Streptosporangium sp. CA-135522 TaxID=3240072 RepID=UPI003D8C4F77
MLDRHHHHHHGRPGCGHSPISFIGSTIAGFIAGPEGRLDFFFPVADDVTAAILAEFPETVPTPFRGPAGLADTWPVGRRAADDHEGVVECGASAPPVSHRWG